MAKQSSGSDSSSSGKVDKSRARLTPNELVQRGFVDQTRRADLERYVEAREKYKNFFRSPNDGRGTAAPEWEAARAALEAAKARFGQATERVRDEILQFCRFFESGIEPELKVILGQDSPRLVQLGHMIQDLRNMFSRIAGPELPDNLVRDSIELYFRIDGELGKIQRELEDA